MKLKLNLQLHAGESPTNKVKYGLKNVHYAVATVTDGTYAWGTPKRIPGAVNLALPPVGDKTEFFADDMAYFVTTANQGYEGNLEIALIPDSFKIDVLKEKADASGALFEDANAIPANIALLFEFSGDVNSTRHVLYNCSVARPEIKSKTKEKGIEVQTESLNLTASPLPGGIVKGKAKPADTCYEGWYGAVYEYVEPEA